MLPSSWCAIAHDRRIKSIGRNRSWIGCWETMNRKQQIPWANFSHVHLYLAGEAGSCPRALAQKNHRWLLLCNFMRKISPLWTLCIPKSCEKMAGGWHVPLLEIHTSQIPACLFLLTGTAPRYINLKKKKKESKTLTLFCLNPPPPWDLPLCLFRSFMKSLARNQKH